MRNIAIKRTKNCETLPGLFKCIKKNKHPKQRKKQQAYQTLLVKKHQMSKLLCIKNVDSFLKLKQLFIYLEFKK